jgi:hypothetical protein
MKILAQFGIFISIIILNIGSKKANTQIFFLNKKKGCKIHPFTNKSIFFFFRI